MIKEFTAKGAKIKQRMASNLAKGPDVVTKIDTHPEKVRFEITNSSLIFPGWDRPALEPLLGKKELGGCSVALIVRNNQSLLRKTWWRFSLPPSEEEVTALLKEAFANPSYSNYCSNDGKNFSTRHD